MWPGTGQIKQISWGSCFWLLEWFQWHIRRLEHLFHILTRHGSNDFTQSSHCKVTWPTLVRRKRKLRISSRSIIFMPPWRMSVERRRVRGVSWWSLYEWPACVVGGGKWKMMSLSFATDRGTILHNFASCFPYVDLLEPTLWWTTAFHMPPLVRPAKCP